MGQNNNRREQYGVGKAQLMSRHGEGSAVHEHVWLTGELGHRSLLMM